MQKMNCQKIIQNFWDGVVVTIMEDKPVYVFDEWAADQDPQFRNYFYMTLLPESKAQGKTVIAVTHDDMYFHVADRVLHVNNGSFEYDQGYWYWFKPHLVKNVYNKDR